MLIATVISGIWIKTAYGTLLTCTLTAEHFTHLAGIAAPNEFQKLVIYKVSQGLYTLIRP